MIDEWKKGAKYWDKAWNPVVGCYPVSDGCENCYAAALADRLPELRDKDGGFTPHVAKRKNPPRSGVVFVGNMTDLFGAWNDSTQICHWMGTLSPAAINLVLTKRADSMRNCLNALADLGYFELLALTYFGFTAENQSRYNERLRAFRGVRFRVRGWLSAEPLLEPVDMQLRYIAPEDMPFDWVVVGAESGPNRRPCKVEWVESIVEQCRAAGVKVFVKQLDMGGRLVKDINEFPPHLRIREVPWK